MDLTFDLMANLIESLNFEAFNGVSTNFTWQRSEEEAASTMPGDMPEDYGIFTCFNGVCAVAGARKTHKFHVVDVIYVSIMAHDDGSYGLTIIVNINTEK